MKDKNMNIETETIYKQTVKCCPMFYSDAHKSMQETCMCWGWEFGKGWYELARNMSYEIELLNRWVYPKYRLKIVADQMKEKFGDLTVYWQVRHDPCWFGRKINEMFDKLYRRLRKVDYAYVKVVDEPTHDEIETKEITEKEFDAERKSKIKCANVKLERRDGKYYRVVTYTVYEKSHQVPTRHKLLYKFMRYCRRARSMFTAGDKTFEQEMMSEYLYNKAREIVNKYTQKAYETCECCGNQIGKSSWSPRCTTAGWITYLCKDCAEKKEAYYTIEGKEGEFYKGKRVKAKKQKTTSKKA